MIEQSLASVFLVDIISYSFQHMLYLCSPSAASRAVTSGRVVLPFFCASNCFAGSQFGLLFGIGPRKELAYA